MEVKKSKNLLFKKLKYKKSGKITMDYIRTKKKE